MDIFWYIHNGIQWQKGQQYMIAKASLLETDGREGIEVLKDEPFQNEMGKGNFTHKVFHLTRYWKWSSSDLKFCKVPHSSNW